MMNIRCLVDARASVGEGPVWNEADGCLWWIDIKIPRLFRTEPESGETTEWPLPERIGSFAFRHDGTLICAMKSGFKIFDPQSEGWTDLADPESHLPGNRFNDGKCDASGRFFAGTMDDEEFECTGSLYRLDPDHTITTTKTGISISNGLGWSPDHRTMYYTDTKKACIWAYDYAIATGAMTNERIFADVPVEHGYPDGLCVDAEGFVWGAHWEGWRVTRYAPDGSVDRVVEMPVPKITSCCFGGPDMTTLFITSARIDLDEPALAKAPLSGGLFAIQTDVRGQPCLLFGG
jgi:sugar lactone lactonase YvrE